jgi:hypothetical protein
MFRPQDMPQKVSKAQAYPAPVGGLNDLDPLAQMDVSFLLDDVNFMPDTGNLNVRNGYQEWVTGLSSVKTIIQFAMTDGTFHKFACTDNGIYNIDASVNAPPLVAASTNGMWESTNFTTPNGQYLVMVNGTDPSWLYNASTWVNWKELASPVNPGEISGVDPSTFVYVLPHQHRLWFAVKNSMTVYYLPTDSVGGAAQPIFLGSIFRKGGYIVGMSRWSANSGSGINDRIIFYTSSGEIASYFGTDPSDMSTWSLDAVFYIGAPLSRRSFMDYGGDVIILTKRGVVPVSSLISQMSVEAIYGQAMTRRISRTVIKYTKNASAAPFVPEITLYPDSAWIVINIYKPNTLLDPVYGPTQLVMNILTGAWGRFDYPVRTIRTCNDGFYMGTDDGRVLKITFDQYLDDVKMDGSGGNPISAYAMGAYTYLDDPTFNKHAQFIRPVFQATVKPSFIIRVLPDFRTDLWGSTPIPGLAVGNAVWDISKWDMANWAGNDNVYRPWCSANVLGYAFAWQLKVSTSAALGLSAVEWVWEDGDLI